MHEEMPQPKREGDEMEEFVPDYIFDSAWQKGNFLIPADKEIRNELKHVLEGFSRYGIMWKPENAKTRSVLTVGIVVIEAYDDESRKSK